MRKLIALVSASALIASQAQAQTYNPPLGAGTITSIVCPNGTITVSGSCKPSAAAGTSGDVMTSDGNHGIQDSGTPISSVGGIGGWLGAVSGRWYPPYNETPQVNGATEATATRYCVLELRPAAITVSALATRVTTLAAGGNIELGLYQDSGGSPGALLGVTSSISVAATGPVSGTVTAFSLTAGQRYWACVDSDNATVILQGPSVVTSSTAAMLGNSTLSTVSLANASIGPLMITTTVTFGAWNAGTTYTWTASVSGTGRAAYTYLQEQ